MSKAKSLVAIVAYLLLIATGLGGLWYAAETLERADRLDAEAARRAAGQYHLFEEIRFQGYDFSVQEFAEPDTAWGVAAKPGRQFVVITTEVTNTGQAPLTFTGAPAVQLIGADGVAHDHDVAASQAFADHAAAAGLTLYAYGEAVVIAPGDHKAVTLIYDLREGQFDRRTWCVGLRGQNVRVSLVPPPPDPNAPVYDVFD